MTLGPQFQSVESRSGVKRSLPSLGSGETLSDRLETAVVPSWLSVPCSTVGKLTLSQHHVLTASSLAGLEVEAEPGSEGGLQVVTVRVRVAQGNVTTNLPCVATAIINQYLYVKEFNGISGGHSFIICIAIQSKNKIYLCQTYSEL